MKYVLFLFALVICCNSVFAYSLVYSYSYNLPNKRFEYFFSEVPSLQNSRLCLFYFYGGSSSSSSAIFRDNNSVYMSTTSSVGSWSNTSPWDVFSSVFSAPVYITAGSGWGVIYILSLGENELPPSSSSFGTPYLPEATEDNPYPLPVVPNPPTGGSTPDNPENPDDPDNPTDPDPEDPEETPTGPFDVNVINRPTVNIGNTPTVNIGNTPTVNIGNIPNVFLTNESLKVFVQNEDLVDYQKIPGSSLTNPSHVNLSVPSAPAAKNYDPEVFYQNFIGYLYNPTVTTPVKTPGLTYSYPVFEFKYNGLDFDLKIGDVQKDILPQFNLIKAFVKSLITLIISVFFFINVIKIFKK